MARPYTGPGDCWPDAYSHAAHAEGWDIFWTCSGMNGHGPEIQALDELEVFASDADTLAHCLREAAAGSAIHQLAVDLEISWDHDMDKDPYPNGTVDDLKRVLVLLKLGKTWSQL